MRNIKFRAYDKILKRFIDLGDFVVDPLNGTAIDIFYGEITFKMNGVILEQYTGLKDFHGAEIYEGDILQDVDNGTIVGFVEYDPAFGEYDCGDNNLYECTRDCVVIGNIHENADLLEEK